MKAPAIGAALPTLEVSVGVSDIVAMSIATRDFHPVHHDVERARAAGHPTLFLNLMSTAGLVERFARQWSGAGARLERMTFRLGVPHYAGEMLRIDGSVATAGEEAGMAWTEVEFQATNARGTHASGRVRVRTP